MFLANNLLLAVLFPYMLYEEVNIYQKFKKCPIQQKLIFHLKEIIIFYVKNVEKFQTQILA